MAIITMQATVITRRKSGVTVADVVDGLEYILAPTSGVKLAKGAQCIIKGYITRTGKRPYVTPIEIKAVFTGLE